MIDSIVIHHTKSPDGKTRDWDGIRKYHKSWRYNGNIISKEEADKLINDGHIVERPCVDIGYNAGVELIDGTYECQWGRSLNIPGAHCIGMNHRSVGIAVVGDFDVDTPSDELYAWVSFLCVLMMKLFPEITIERVFPHSSFANKTCPGHNFDMTKLKDIIKNHLGGQ